MRLGRCGSCRRWNDQFVRNTGETSGPVLDLAYICVVGHKVPGFVPLQPSLAWLNFTPKRMQVPLLPERTCSRPRIIVILKKSLQ